MRANERLSRLLTGGLKALLYVTLCVLLLRSSFLKFELFGLDVSLTSVKNLGLFFVIFWLVSFLLFRRNASLRSPLDLAIALFLLASLLSLAFSPLERVRWGKPLISLFLYAGFFYACRDLFTVPGVFRRTVLTLLYLSAFVAAADLLYRAWVGWGRILDRTYPFWDGKNALGLLCAMAGAFSLGCLLGRDGLPRGKKGLLCAHLLVVLLCLVFSYSRSAWFGFLCALPVLCLASRGRRGWPALLFVPLFFVVLLGLSLRIDEHLSRPASIVLNTKKKILDADGAFERLSGYNRGELVGTDAGKVLARSADYREERIFRLLMQKKHIYNLHIDIRRKDGTRVPVLLEAVLMRIRGTPPSVVCRFMPVPEETGVLSLSRRVGSLLSLRDANVRNRFAVWNTALRMLRDRPLTGIGLGSFRYAFRSGYVPRMIDHRDALGTHAHNLLLQVGAETGLLGLSACLLVAVALFLYGGRLLRRESQPLQRAVRLGALGGLVAFFAYSLTDCTFTASLSGSSFLHANLIAILFAAMFLKGDPAA